MLDTNIRVTVNGGDKERYQALLRADWSRDTLDRVLALLWKVISHNRNGEATTWWKSLARQAGKKAPSEIEPGTIATLRDLSSMFSEPAIPNMPSSFSTSRPCRAIAQAEQVWTYLILQAKVKLTGETGFFQDLQSLLFHCAAHFLLPQLKRQGLAAERACLACAMYLHTLLVWKTEPAHLLHLQSVLMDQLGQRERRLELLDLAFHLTSPQDHVYLTRATAYWSELMEQRQYDKASSFLFSLTKHAPDACQDEIRDMLSETLVEAKSHTR